MWIIENRTHYDGSSLHHPSDLTEEVWRFIGPLIPPARWGGSEHLVEARKARNGIMRILSSDCLLRREHGRTLNGLHDPLCAPCRDQTVRETSPTAAVIDGQSLEGGGKEALDAHGDDMSALFGMFVFLLKLHADAGDQGPKFRQCRAGFAPEPVSRSSSAPTRGRSSSCRNAGSARGPSPGPAAAGRALAKQAMIPGKLRSGLPAMRSHSDPVWAPPACSGSDGQIVIQHRLHAQIKWLAPTPHASPSAV